MALAGFIKKYWMYSDGVSIVFLGKNDILLKYN